METNETVEEQIEIYFHKPSLILRVKSMMIDSLVIVVLMVIVAAILNNLGIESGGIRGIALGLIFLYEPILTTLHRTLGQKIMGLRVVALSEYINTQNRKNINLISSLIRYFVKILLGWISILTIHSDKYGQAIHDKAGGSLITIEK